jgi:hypothetical protein
VDITHSEHVEKELDLIISRRDAQRRKTEGERLEEGLWRESERRHAEHRREQNRLAWLDYHRAAAERTRRTLEALISDHETKAEKLCAEESGNGHKGEEH